jgi:hypothetical protein
MVAKKRYALCVDAKGLGLEKGGTQTEDAGVFAARREGLHTRLIEDDKTQPFRGDHATQEDKSVARDMLPVRCSRVRKHLCLGLEPTCHWVLRRGCRRGLPLAPDPSAGKATRPSKARAREQGGVSVQASIAGEKTMPRRMKKSKEEEEEEKLTVSATAPEEARVPPPSMAAVAPGEEDKEDLLGRTKVRVAQRYNLLANNCSKLLDFLFPGRFSCAHPLVRVLWTPSSCHPLREEDARLAGATERWLRERWHQERHNSSFGGCALEQVLRRSLASPPSAQRRLRVAVAYVQHRWLWFAQHLTLFLYFEGQQNSVVCTVGVNVPMNAMLGLTRRNWTVSSPDRALGRLFSPDDLHVVADFHLERHELLSLCLRLALQCDDLPTTAIFPS